MLYYIMFCGEMKDEEKGETKEEVKLERKNTPENIKWRSCCLLMSKDFVMFFTKYFIIICLLCFFSVELHMSEKCEDKNLYQSLLLLCLGLAIPSPTLR